MENKEQYIYKDGRYIKISSFSNSGVEDNTITIKEMALRSNFDYRTIDSSSYASQNRVLDSIQTSSVVKDRQPDPVLYI